MLRQRRVVVPVWRRWAAGSTLGSERVPVPVDEQYRRARYQPPDGSRLSQVCPQASVRRDGAQETPPARTTTRASQRAWSPAAWRHAGCRTLIRQVARRRRTGSPPWGVWTRPERARRLRRRRPGDARERQASRRRWPPAQLRASSGTRQVPQPVATRQRAQLATGDQC